MGSTQIVYVFKNTSVLIAFLFLGMFLRAKIPFFRKLLLPASVIGGFILLVLGPQVWGDAAPLPIPKEYITTWAAVPGVFIVPIFSAVPLGNGWNEPEKDPNAPKESKFKAGAPLGEALIAYACFCQAGSFQSSFGLLYNLVSNKFLGTNFYRNFGYELVAGFSGGHGTAGAVGNVLMNAGAEHWELAQSVATTFATIGLIGGIVLGIAFINRASAKGMTKILDKPGQIPDTVLRGYELDRSKQESLGHETTHNSSIETITVHLGLFIVITAVSYWAREWCVAHNVPGFSSITVWFYGLMIMYPVNWLLKKLKLTWLFDMKLKSKITGAFSDIAITAAIASMQIKAVMAYIVPIAIISFVGFIGTYLLVMRWYVWAVGKKDYPVERAIINWGFMTGVLMTGMMLLKIADPDYESPTLKDFSFAMAISSITGLFTSPIGYSFLGHRSTMDNFIYHFAFFIVYLIVGYVGHVMLKKANPSQFED